MERPTISFLSDYGHQDEFVGVVHSVLRNLAPDAAVIDICHAIAPHDVRAGALTLVRSVQYLAPGVVLAVVDPGVGSARRAIAVEAEDGQRFVGPDNGLLASAVAMLGGAAAAVELTSTVHRLPAPGPTFAGRDLFAPAAAHLASGGDLSDLGPAVDPFGLRPGLLPLSRLEDGTLHAEVLWVDRFGNIQLNVGPEDLEPLGAPVVLGWGESHHRGLTRVEAFADLTAGQLGLLVDSYGLMAITLDRSSAAEELGLGEGDGVRLTAAR